MLRRPNKASATYYISSLNSYLDDKNVKTQLIIFNIFKMFEIYVIPPTIELGG